MVDINRAAFADLFSGAEAIDFVSGPDSEATAGFPSGALAPGASFAQTPSATTFERRGGDVLAPSTTSGNQDGGQVTFLSDGRFVIVWRDASATGGDTSGTAIRGQIFNADGTRSGTEFLVNASTAGNQSSPTLFALPSGGFVVAWTDSPLGSDAEVRAQRFDSAGAPVGAEILVNTRITGLQNGPAGAALADGSFVLTWTDWTAEPAVSGTGGSPVGVRSQLFDPSGAKVGPERAVNTTTQYEQSNPSVAALADGYVIVWQDLGTINGIVGQRFAADGSPVGGEFLVSTVTAWDQRDPSVAPLAGGGFVVTWTDESKIGGDTHYTGIKAQIFDSAGAMVGSEFLANTDTQGYQRYSFVAGTPSGGFVVMWSNTTSTVADGSGAGVKAQYFDPAGVREGGEFWVNSNKLNDQLGSGIAASADGVVAVFADLSGTGGDSSGSAVKFEHFIPAPGTEDPDILVGTEAEDEIHGFGGNDDISGAGAADVLHGGAGDDLLAGGTGNDDLYGDEGADSLSGEAGDDILNGDAGEDVIEGGEGSDGLAGGDGDDILRGGAGGDVLIGGNGNDELDAGDGDDDLYYQYLGANPDHDSAAGGLGIDALFVDFAGIAGGAGIAMTLGADAGGGHAGIISAGADYSVAFTSVELFFVAATEAADQIATGDGSDVILAKGGNDVILAGGGNDTIVGGTGADSMTGGLGNDRYEVDDAGDSVVENEGEGTDEVQSRLAAYTLGANLENLTGLLATGQGLTGNALANVIKGGAGADIIDGGAGADTMQGGGGNDLYHVDDAGDVVSDGAGTDEIRVSLASYSIATNLDVENLTATNDAGQTLTGNDLPNIIKGAGGSDVLSGGLGNDQIIGGEGDDRIDGGGGIDTMTGGGGNDTYIVGTPDDIVIEAVDGGIDELLIAETGYFRMAANVENATVVGGAWHIIVGNSLNNVLTGNDYGDTLDGGGGDDTMIGGAGFDTYHVDSLNDVIIEAADDIAPPGTYGDKVVTSLAEYTLRSDLERLQGDSSQQRLVGNDKANELSSGGGSDTLVGGKGDDEYSVQPGDVIVELEGEGTDTVYVNAGNFTLSDALENLSGQNSSGQILTGNRFANRVSGSSGNDIIDGAGGADAMAGGGGNDIYYVDEAGDTVTEGSNSGTDEVRTALATYTLGANVENFRGLAATGQVVYGNTLSNTMTGGEGDDVLHAESGGGDTLRRGGSDIVSGNGGNDTIIFGAGFTSSDQANGGAGTDTLILQGSYNLTFTAAMVQSIETVSLLAYNDPTYGGAGTLAVSYRLTSIDSTVAAGSAMTLDARSLSAGDTVNFNGAAETNGSFVLLGGAGADTLTGGALADSIDGGAGSDIMAGGKGDDVYVVSQTGDSVTELAGEGTDEVRTTLASYTLGANLEKLTGLSTFGQTLTGNNSANTVVGGSGGDRLDGGGGDDVMRGGQGDDVYLVDSAGDQALENENEGRDEIRTSLAAFVLGANFEKLTGTSATGQILTGNSAGNTIEGGEGDDVIEGGGGSDYLYGHGGADRFLATLPGSVSAHGGAGLDTLVADFSSSLERVVNPMSISQGASGWSGYYVSGSQFYVSFTDIDRLEIITGAADDLLTGSGGDDRLILNGGNDSARGQAGNDHLEGGAGNDWISGGSGSDTLIGGEGSDVLEAAANSSTFTRPSGASEPSSLPLLDTGTEVDTLSAGAGSDTLSAGYGDSVDGGTGVDGLYISFQGAQSGVAADFRALASGGSVTIGGATIADIERLMWVEGSEYADFIAVPDNLGYDDPIYGRGGDDVIVGGSATGNIYGGAGNDRIDNSASVYGGYIYGDAGDDAITDGAVGNHLFGGDGADSIFGRGGTDYGYGGAGGDVIDGGSFNDVLYGDADSDTLYGNGDNDKLYGGDGDDILYGDETPAGTQNGLADANFPNRDELYGGAGSDRLYGNQGNDLLQGGDGDDRLDGGESGDEMHGGAGNDLYIIDSADLVFEDANSGIDEIRTAAASYVLGANFENLTITSYGDTPRSLRGNALDNVLTTEIGQAFFDLRDGGADRAYGATHADIFYFGATFGAGDRADGGTSDDEVALQGNYSGLTLAAESMVGIQTLTLLSAGSNRFGAAAAGAAYSYDITLATGFTPALWPMGPDDLEAQFFVDASGLAAGESLRFDGTADDGSLMTLVVRGGAGADTLRAGSGGAMFDGGGGADLLAGGAGNDRLAGGDGNDILHLWNGGGDDLASGGDGNDNIFFGATLTSADVVTGGAGVDTLVVQGPYGSLTLTANITQIENVSILGGNNTNFGEPGTNRYDYVLTTHDANFAAGVQARINGAALLEGEDFTFDGSAETDASYVVYGGKGKDTLLGGLGNDIFFYAEERFASGDTVNGGAGYDGMFLRGNYTIDFNAPGYTGLFTNIENLTLTSATDERYARGGGTEFDYNLTLSDAIVKPGETLTVSGALLMASETMVLDGSAELDGLLRLFGGRASDTLKGGGQSDLIHGNLGADILAGNGGADTFRFDSIAESNSGSMDQITDFTSGTDKVDLGRIDADTLTAGNQAFAWIGSAAFSGTAGQLRAYEQDGSWFVEGDTNGDTVADLVIRITVMGDPLTQSDFLP